MQKSVLVKWLCCECKLEIYQTTLKRHKGLDQLIQRTHLRSRTIQTLRTNLNWSRNRNPQENIKAVAAYRIVKSVHLRAYSF